jgi:hypothetical protein
MRRKLIPLLTVFALLLVAVGGAAATGDASTTTTPDATPTEGGDVGICVVGADSPCNDAPDDAENATDANESTDGERIGDDDDADDGQMRIPEDQDGDGEIDDRFRGDGNPSAGDESSDDAGICVVGADSPCNDASSGSDADNATDATHPTPSDGEHIGSDSGGSDEGQMWIPEDQNRDGEIDDRFLDSAGPLADLLSPLLGAF